MVLPLSFRRGEINTIPTQTLPFKACPEPVEGGGLQSGDA
jgi:hypothetical protein